MRAPRALWIEWEDMKYMEDTSQIFTVLILTSAMEFIILVYFRGTSL